MNLLARQSDERMAKRPNETKTCIHLDGMSERIRAKMRDMFLRGNHSIGEVAKAVGVSYTTAKRCLEMDDELRNIWETTFQSRMDEVEGAMIERAIDSPNAIASQQAGEFLLRHHRKQIYGDNALSDDMIKSLPKILVAPVVVRSRSPLEPEVIDVK